ncbi:MAG: HAD family hydrolase [Oscillospiraceae bacterium]|nr:HAD family hydrolase [Oscillospiraceae bacterium]
MSMDKTLYISDLDGTLLNNSAELSEYATNTLNAMIARGLRFSVATARTLASSAKILCGLMLRLPIVLMNGVLIYDMERKQYTQVNYLAPKTVSEIIRTLSRFEITGFMYELKDGELMTYHESLEKKPLRDFVEERIAKYNKAFQHTDGFDRISPENVIYFTLLDTRERLMPVYEALSTQTDLKLTFYEDIYRPGFWYLEIFSDKASKQNAVDHLREAYGFEHVVGFGDNLNDLPMFAACDIKVAAGNAKPEVKAIANYICSTNDNDGVVKWLEENAI